MKIVKVEDLHCNARPRFNSFLKITTDDGNIGWSEYMEGYGGQGLTGLIHKLAAHYLIGAEPRPVERMTALRYAATRQAPAASTRWRLVPSKMRSSISRPRH
jgi:galactonate dehydratase